MKPKTLKPWSFVKDQRHDLSQIQNRWNKPDPNDYYYQLDVTAQLYTPAVLVIDFESIPTNNKISHYGKKIK
jgi:hypothetical protein